MCLQGTVLTNEAQGQFHLLTTSRRVVSITLLRPVSIVSEAVVPRTGVDDSRRRKFCPCRDSELRNLCRSARS
jgi:hypothetical protein